MSNAPSSPTTLVVAPIGPPLSAVAGSLLSAPAGQSPVGTGGSSLDSGGLLGSGPVTGPSGGSSSSGASPTGTPSDAPSYGGGQPAGGQAGNVEDQLARTWAEYGKDWYDWAKPAIDIITGIAQTAIDAVVPSHVTTARDLTEIGAKGGSVILTVQQQRRAEEALLNDPEGRGISESQELERMKRLHNERSKE